MSQRPRIANLLIIVGLGALLLSPVAQATVQEWGGMQVIPMRGFQDFTARGQQSNLAYQAFNRPAASAVPAGLMEVDQEVSDRFVQEIKQGLAKIQGNVLRALAGDGYKVTLSESVTEAVPAAKHQQVRGYQPHATWDTVYGMFNRTTKRVIMAEKAEQKDASGRTAMEPLRNIERRNGILRHECGHAVDQYLGHLSHSPEFKRAYEKGLKSISAHERKVLSYYLQPGDAGREETFAEIFASLNDYACDRNSDILLKNNFPELVSLIRSKVATIKG